MVAILSVVIAALGLIVVILGGILRYVITQAKENAISSERLSQVAKDLEKLVASKEKDHAALAAQMRADRDLLVAQIRADREATNERLIWLEHNLWNKS